MQKYLWLGVLLVGTGICRGDVVRMPGTSVDVGFRVAEGTVLLDVGEVAEALKWEWKVVSAGKLGTFCRDVGCIPLRLEKVKSLTVGKRLFLDGNAVGKVLGFRVVGDGKSLALVKGKEEEAKDEVGAYHVAWGEGRGFRVGQRVPDIPLVDLNGKEVRFSRYLGKQYIIYCWASW